MPVNTAGALKKQQQKQKQQQQQKTADRAPCGSRAEQPQTPIRTACLPPFGSEVTELQLVFQRLLLRCRLSLHFSSPLCFCASQLGHGRTPTMAPVSRATRTHTHIRTHTQRHQEHTNTDLTNDRVARRGELIVGSAPADMPVGRGC